jgi:hypothetical protein
MKYVFGVSDHDLFNKQILIAKYNQYTDEVMSYFSQRPEDLLVLEIDSNNDMGQLAYFLGLESDLSAEPLPWENKSKPTQTDLK